MANFRCAYCGKEFQFQSHFTRHENAKRKCAPTFAKRPEALCGAVQYQSTCRFCNQVFMNETSMYRHIRNSCKIAPNVRNGSKGMDRLYEHTLQKQMAEMKAENTEMKAQNAHQSAEIAEMKAMMQLLLDRQGAPSSSSTLQAGEIAFQGDHAQVDNSKKIVINVFGQEKLDHVTAERIKTILDECLQRPALPTAVDEAILKTAMLVYSDPDHPENLTAYLPNKKTKDALVHTEAGWEVQPTQLVLPPMALKSIDTIFGKQPHEGEYVPLLKELQQNEARFAAGEDLRPILVRNKDLLARALETLPLVGRP